ncbi:hypothetical protein [Streptomyces sp. NPDC059862]|uniref:hypothetical protein n=1 Tax=unclassified Streptomyces TaxID=2593676 RepID=UPI00363F7041
MHSEPAIENRAAPRGRRRKRGNGSASAPGSAAGPVFVDNSGRRARLLRRIGLLLGVACLGYAVVLGAAFMGWGTSLNPSSLLPFAGGANGQGDPAPQGGPGNGAVPPGGTPSAPPSGAAVPSPPPTSSASAVAAAN